MPESRKLSVAKSRFAGPQTTNKKCRTPRLECQIQLKREIPCPTVSFRRAQSLHSFGRTVLSVKKGERGGCAAPLSPCRTALIRCHSVAKQARLPARQTRSGGNDVVGQGIFLFSRFRKFCCMITAQRRPAFQTTNGLRRYFCVAAIPGLKPGVIQM